MLDERSASTPAASADDVAEGARQPDEQSPGRMVDDPASEEAHPLQATGTPGGHDATAGSWLTTAWQIPLIFLSTGLILVGFLMMRSRTEPAPDPTVFLEVAEQRISEGRMDDARKALARAETVLSKAVDSSETTAQRGRLLLAQADLESRRSRIPRNDQRVLSLYEEAQSLGMRLTPEQEARRAAALAALGDHDAAFETFFSTAPGADSPEASPIRRRVLGVLVEHAQQGDSTLRDQLVGHLDVYAAGDASTLEDAIWAVVQAARLRLAAGDHDAGLERLMRSMRRLEARTDEPGAAAVMQDWLGRVQAIYGRLWLAAGEPVKAREALEEAMGLLPDGEDDRLLAEASLAEIDRREGYFEEAIGRFGSILARHPSADARMEVHLYRAETYAANGDHELSVADYTRVVDLLDSGAHPMADRLVGSLEDRVREESLLDRPEQAVTYARLVLDSSLLVVSDEVLGLVARAYRSLGEAVLASAYGLEPEAIFVEGIDDSSPEMRREAALSFRQAGTLFDLLATRLHERNEARSGWSEIQASAAECFDLGADRVRAISAYAAYLKGTPVENGGRARVALKYAQALHSNLQFSEALSAYDAIVELHGQGIYAAKARVAGADCLVALERPREAQVRLELIVSGSDGIRPEAPEFQDAIFALGRLMHESELHEDAVVRLDEAVRRYPTDERLPEASFMLGSSLESMAATERGRELDRAFSPSVRDRARAAWVAHTEAAIVAFEQVIAAFGSSAEDLLEPGQARMLRDARVGCANGLLDLGRYMEAIELYEQIERRYRAETTSLDALIRLNEAWAALGRQDEAEKAHSRAVLRLRQLPEDVFASSRFDRSGWSTWLERRPLRVAAGTALEQGIVQGSEADDG